MRPDWMIAVLGALGLAAVGALIAGLILTSASASC